MLRLLGEALPGTQAARNVTDTEVDGRGLPSAYRLDRATGTWRQDRGSDGQIEATPKSQQYPEYRAILARPVQKLVRARIAAGRLFWHPFRPPRI